MTPDFENKSDAFHCGRLFALLEYIQRRAADTELNKTIKDAYFSSACSRPASVFPGLIKLSQHHMAKIKRNTKYDYNRAVGEIINRIQNGFPVLMTLDEQGEFIIGYYNQNTMLYTPVKKEAAGTTAAADASEENTQENLTENTQN